MVGQGQGETECVVYLPCEGGREWYEKEEMIAKFKKNKGEQKEKWPEEI
jgi:hypothetical protein